MGDSPWTSKICVTEIKWNEFKAKNLNKCEFAKSNIRFLGHIVSREGTHLNQKKIKVIEYLVPIFVTNIRGYMAFTWYYYNYVKGYSPIVIPFFEFTKKDVMFTWTPQCQNAFDALKEH